MTNAAPRSIGTAEFALRLLASRGTAAYLAYLVEAAEITAVIEDVAAELVAIDDQIEIDILNPSPDAESLLHGLALRREVLLIGAAAYGDEDFRLLDRRRASLAREGVTVFFLPPSGFDALMRVAPNLDSWLGGLVFSREDEGARIEARRAQRLAALREWSGKTDAEVIQAAKEGSLPRDPEYGEWLVLLGRGELLNA